MSSPGEGWGQVLQGTGGVAGCAPGGQYYTVLLYCTGAKYYSAQGDWQAVLQGVSHILAATLTLNCTELYFTELYCADLHCT